VVQNKFYALWAKKPKIDEPEQIIPLQTHLKKTADEAENLWETWLPKALQKQIDRQMLIFLAYAHDLGKASPAFQTRPGYNIPDTDEKTCRNLERAGFLLNGCRDMDRKHTPHALVSYGILKRNGFNDSVSVIVGGHHGAPPSTGQINSLRRSEWDSYSGFNNETWEQAQDELLEEALKAAGLTKTEATTKIISRPVQVLYSGLVILADWIASSEEPVELPTMWQAHKSDDVYKQRFQIDTPRPVQSALLEAVKAASSPGIFIVEAPMGEGKTEAALAAAEMLAGKAF